MTTGHYLDFLGISMDPKKAEGPEFTVNLVTPDNGEKYIVELSNATLPNIEGFQDPNADPTLTVDRADLNRVMMGVASFDQLAQEGKARFDGDRTVIAKLRVVCGSARPAELNSSNAFDRIHFLTADPSPQLTSFIVLA